MTRKIMISTIKYVAIAAILFFIGRLIWLDRMEIFNYFRNTKPLFYYSVVVMALFLWVQAWIWARLLNSPDRQLAVSQGITIYVYSQFAKYLPGAVWNLVGRMMLAQKHGATRLSQLRSIYYENALLVCVAIVYGMVLLRMLDIIGWFIFFGFCTLIILFYLCYNSGMHLLERLLSRFLPKLLEVQLQYPRHTFFKYFGYYLISHILMGSAFWLLLRSFGVTSINVWEATGTFVLAWLLGLVSPLPGGMGLREGAITYLLSLQIELALSYRIAIIARIWSLCSEILIIILIGSIDYIRKVRKRSYE